jgi:hypothetical protein
MTKKYVLTALLLCFSAASCAKGPAPSESKTSSVQPPAAGAVADAKPQGADAAAAVPKAPVVPAGAEWTIYCMSIPGAGHIQHAIQLRDQLIKNTGMRDWYVIHGQTESTLYYGFYKSFDKNIKATRAKIDAMTDTSNGRPFKNALIVELTAPDPEAPPQWNLANAPAGMLWSLQIGAYEGSPERKKAAVDAVREARAQGVPAYFYHGPSISSVCIGNWPKQAVRGDMEPAFNDPDERRPMAEIMAQQPGDLIVLPPGMPPVDKDLRVNNRKVRAVSPRLEAVEPSLLAAMKNYPYHFRNGEAEGMKTKTGVQPKPSFLVKIPRRNDTLLGSDGSLAGPRQGQGPAGTSQPQPANDRRPAPATPGYGKLRSLEGN